MKKTVLTLVIGFLIIQAQAMKVEIKEYILSDGEKTEGRLCLPAEPVESIVFVVHGTGPYTYLTKRATFNYYDVLAEGFCEQGVGFFTYNRRGVKPGEEAPWYYTIDSLKYAKYLPHQEADDIETMIGYIKEDRRFENSKIILYGISEGTIIASMVAERAIVKPDAIFLHGYVHDNMYDIIKWQNTGEGAMILINSIFDKDGNAKITREEYEREDPVLNQYRAYLFPKKNFDSIDMERDNILDIKDLRIMNSAYHKQIMDNIIQNNEAWIWNNYTRITIAWLKEHFCLEANKTRLLKINVPIYIFHGADDANVPATSVYDIWQLFEACGKDNLTIYVFEKHNHDLNFQEWISSKKYSQGLQTLFIIAKTI